MANESFGPFLRLHPLDNVLITRVAVGPGLPLEDGPGGAVVREPVGAGHKVAVRDIRRGDPVRKFGQVIGFASRDVPAGSWVHVHNVEIGNLALDHAIGSEVPAAPSPIAGRTFLGYRRPDGRAATRNYVGIVSTVNCSATASKYVASRIGREILDRYPNVDGVVALTHKGGCAMQEGGEDHEQLARTLAGFAKHPNFAAYVVIGLGCETGQAGFLVDRHLVQLDGAGSSNGHGPPVLTLQDEGGTARTVDRATGLLRELLPEVDRYRRTPIPVSELIVGTECGGSDGYSGISANPAVGAASDLVVAHGGTAILSETPEMVGAEHLLTRRAVRREVGEKLLERIAWWREYLGKFGVILDNNPSVGNKRGGLTTIYEKSLGAVAKGGSTALRAVYGYAERVVEKGFVVMDTPGYDPASVTGMVAGGANVVVFTTGRGSCFGCKPVPSIKVATNTPMFDRMRDDMDVNAGRILDGATVEEVGREIFEKIVAVAGGEQTKSEAQGIGDEEFCPWSIGPVL
jgi:altronate hydrolase